MANKNNFEDEIIKINDRITNVCNEFSKTDNGNNFVAEINKIYNEIERYKKENGIIENMVFIPGKGARVLVCNQEEYDEMVDKGELVEVDGEVWERFVLEYSQLMIDAMNEDPKGFLESMKMA